MAHHHPRLTDFFKSANTFVSLVFSLLCTNVGEAARNAQKEITVHDEGRTEGFKSRVKINSNRPTVNHQVNWLTLIQLTFIGWVIGRAAFRMKKKKHGNKQ